MGHDSLPKSEWIEDPLMDLHMTTMKQIADRVKTVMDRHSEEVQRTRAHHLAVYAIAFLEEAGYPATEAVLCEETYKTLEGGIGTRWYFKKKE
jgi:hypothetical protein